MSALNELAWEIHNDAVAKGFWEPPHRRLPEILALLHSEVSEAFEAWRDDKEWEMELGDVIIVALDVLSEAGCDIDTKLATKMAYNRRRTYQHSRKI